MIRNLFLRVGACLLALMLLFSTGTANAEGIDLSKMSDAEIVALLQEVTKEVARRGIEKTAKLAKGTYIAGIDFPCGKYMYTCLAKDDDWGNVTVYSDHGNGQRILWEVVSAPEEGEEPETIFLNHQRRRPAEIRRSFQPDHHDKRQILLTQHHKAVPGAPSFFFREIYKCCYRKKRRYSRCPITANLLV